MKENDYLDSIKLTLQCESAIKLLQSFQARIVALFGIYKDIKYCGGLTGNTANSLKQHAANYGEVLELLYKLNDTEIEEYKVLYKMFGDLDIFSDLRIINGHDIFETLRDERRQLANDRIEYEKYHNDPNYISQKRAYELSRQISSEEETIKVLEGKKSAFDDYENRTKTYLTNKSNLKKAIMSRLCEISGSGQGDQKSWEKSMIKLISDTWDLSSEEGRKIMISELIHNKLTSLEYKAVKEFLSSIGIYPEELGKSGLAGGLIDWLMEHKDNLTDEQAKFLREVIGVLNDSSSSLSDNDLVKVTCAGSILKEEDLHCNEQLDDGYHLTDIDVYTEFVDVEDNINILGEILDDDNHITDHIMRRITDIDDISHLAGEDGINHITDIDDISHLAGEDGINHITNKEDIKTIIRR